MAYLSATTYPSATTYLGLIGIRWVLYPNSDRWPLVPTSTRWH